MRITLSNGVTAEKAGDEQTEVIQYIYNQQNRNFLYFACVVVIRGNNQGRRNRKSFCSKVLMKI